MWVAWPICVGSSILGVSRLTMTLFEIFFLAVEFTLIRYLTAVPLVMLFSDRLVKYLENRKHIMKSPAISDPKRRRDSPP